MQRTSFGHENTIQTIFTLSTLNVTIKYDALCITKVRRVFYVINSGANFYIDTSAKRATNNAAIIVITISFLVYLPVSNVISTYAIAPTPIPLEIE